MLGEEQKSHFRVARAAFDPGCVKTLVLEVGAGSRPARLTLSPDRLRQATNAQNADYSFHVVGQDVQRHFGTDMLERLHLEVRRSHPGLYGPEGVLDSLAAHPNLARIPIEPRLHGLKDGFVLPA